MQAKGAGEKQTYQHMGKFWIDFFDNVSKLLWFSWVALRPCQKALG